MEILSNIDFNKLKKSLTKTRDSIVSKISEAVTRRAQIDGKTIEEIEDILISSDLGSELTGKIINNAKTILLKEKDRTIDRIKEILKDELVKLLIPSAYQEDFSPSISNTKPYLILVVGINGSGKTTTIGKLAYNYKSAGNKVIIGSADTFRAAANDQLKSWAGKAGVDIIEDIAKDPAAVVFETITTAKEKEYDVVLIDTAGRLHNNKNLMQELNKIRSVASNLLQAAPNECLLVIDGNSGQNALQQALEFNKHIVITGIIITKLDGTAKGGAIFRIVTELKIPIRFIGIGEGIDDLQKFDAVEFVNAIFS